MLTILTSFIIMLILFGIVKREILISGIDTSIVPEYHDVSLNFLYDFFFKMHTFRNKLPKI